MIIRAQSNQLTDCQVMDLSLRYLADLADHIGLLDYWLDFFCVFVSSLSGILKLSLYQHCPFFLFLFDVCFLFVGAD
jgi:hypothetical protein